MSSGKGGSTATLELIDQRLSEIETFVFGQSDDNAVEQSPLTANVDARFAEITSKMSLYTTGRRNINRIFSQMQQLEHAVDMSMKPANSNLAADIAALRAQCEVIMLEEQQLLKVVENLKQMAQLQSVLSSKPISDSVDFSDRLVKISAKQQEQMMKLDEVTEKTNAVVIAYNKLVSELGAWASVWCEENDS